MSNDAIDIDMSKEPISLSERNWFGMRKHPTDKYIDWNLSHDDAKRVSIPLRNAYNSIIRHGLQREMNILLKVSRDYEYRNK